MIWPVAKGNACPFGWKETILKVNFQQCPLEIESQLRAWQWRIKSIFARNSHKLITVRNFSAGLSMQRSWGSLNNYSRKNWHYILNTTKTKKENKKLHKIYLNSFFLISRIVLELYAAKHPFFASTQLLLRNLWSNFKIQNKNSSKTIWKISL